MKRLLDMMLALGALLVLCVPMIIIALLVGMTSRGPVLYWSDRVGRDNAVFRMLKFRTMKIDTPAIATHLLDDPARHITYIGGFLRAFSLDELPQLINILRGDMSFVGPRPALFNQHDLIALRTSKNIHRLMPGLTGWAQINGRDELPIPVKVALDEYYMNNRSVWFDIRIILKTCLRVFKREGVSH